jgi:hypothetical protein
VVIGLEEPQGPTTPRQVVHQPRHGLDELRDLLDEGRDDEVGEPSDPEDREQEDNARREAAAEPPPLEELDGRVECRGEEDRDQHPCDHAPGEVHDREDD